MTTTINARIMRQTGGFYYVIHQGIEVECRARGLLRKQNIVPLVGDFANVEISGNTLGYVVEITNRRNSLVRPAVANVDRMLLVLSADDPPPNTGVIDRLLAVCEYKGIEACIIITKADVYPQKAETLKNTYDKIGYHTEVVDSIKGCVDNVTALISQKVCVLTGNTGVGKSTLLNAISPELCLKTGETSKKLGRGRHTTRTTELYQVCDGFIADTPGFSSIETIQLERIKKEDLPHCFVEFAPFEDNCKFRDCSHTKEIGCKVLEAVENGTILSSRHKSYVEMYMEAKEIKDWE